MINFTKRCRNKRLCVALLAITLLAQAIFCAATCSAEVQYDYSVAKVMSNDNAETWDLALVGNTDIILDPDKMGFNDAELSYNENVFVVRPSFNPNVEAKHQFDYAVAGELAGCTTCKSIGYSKNIPAKTRLSLDETITMTFRGAARSVQGDEYDVVLKVSDIVLQAKKDGIMKNGAPLIYGSNTVIKLGAFPYRKDDENSGNTGKLHGAGFTVSMELHESGTGKLIEDGHQMLWGFDDIDIHNKLSDCSPYNPNNCFFAEHATIYGHTLNEAEPQPRFYGPFYLASNTELLSTRGGTNGNNITFYHENKNTDASGKTDMLFRINPRTFRYRWAGSYCSTNIVATTATIYFGHSKIFDGVTGDQIEPNSTHTVHDNSASIRFSHSIYRNNIGPKGDNEEYYVAAGANAPSAKGSPDQHYSYNSDPDTTKVVYRKNEQNLNNPELPNPRNIALSPGESKLTWQTLYYQASNAHSALGNLADVRCNLNSTETGFRQQGTACTLLFRPPASFNATVGAEVSANNDGNYSPADGEKALITSEDGMFKIKFNGRITRVIHNSEEDDAGGTVPSEYYTYIAKNAATPTSNMISGTRNPNSNGTLRTTELSVGKSQEVFTQNNVYEGQVKDGETIKICGAITYRNLIDSRIAGGYTVKTAEKCVTVYRGPKPCSIDPSYRFTTESGANIGRLGVANYTISGGDDFAYTKYKPSEFTSSNKYTQKSSIWARPGDSIVFKHDACAGGQFAANNSGLNATTYKTVYTFSGNLRNHISATQTTTVSANDYLFGEALPTKRQNSPLKYNGTRSMDSTNTDGTFPSGDNVELSELSPSATSNSDYERDTHNTQSYSCVNLNPNSDSRFASGHFQIGGRGTGNEDSCHAYSKTATASEVGRMITQSMTWNYLNVTNKKANSTYTSNPKFTVEASAKIPYNYKLQPYIGGTTSHVVYRGANMPINLKVYVTPRKNGAFGTGNSESEKAQNTYATITKETTISAEYFYRRSSTNAEFGRQTITGASYKGRLNQEGAFYGNSTDSSNVANGGTTVGQFDIPVPDSLAIGDKVCARITVTPADSHNSFNTATVYGASPTQTSETNAALMESGTGSKTAEFCRTVAKLPTISVEGSNAYTGNATQGFNTSRFTKQFATNGPNYMFGSWSEYGVYGKVTIDNSHGFASGATFGYHTGNNGAIAINQTRTNDGEVAKSDSTHSNTCVYSTQTFTNANCNSNEVGKAGIGSTAADQFRKRIEDRFTSGSSNWIQPSDYSNNCTTSNWYYNYKCIRAKGEYGSVHPYADYGVYMNNDRDENGMIHVRINGDAYYGASTTNTSYQRDMAMNHNFWSDTETFNWTYVYEVNGTFVLDGDIKVGDIRDGQNNYRDDPTLDRLGSVRLPIISVKKLHLTNRVKRIDAIILADEIDTCAYNTYSDFLNGNRIRVGSTLSADVCNNTVEFRGPVYTKKLILNRTAGADSGNESVKRAEIFDMNMAAYLWSYNQMSRFSQAVTVEQKEQAPRY